MKRMLFLLMAMLIAASAVAIVDPDDDMMGFYFDLEADYPCIEGAAPYSTHNLYLIVTRPTAAELFGFEAGFTVEGEGMVLGVEFSVENFINVGTNDNMIVGFGEPLETTQATLLATFSIMYMDTTMGPLDFYLHGSEPSSMDPLYPVVLLDGGVLQSMGISAAVGPTAQFNGGCQVLATDNVSFDSIKSLYR
jgi:hypothetical protein